MCASNASNTSSYKQLCQQTSLQFVSPEFSASFAESPLSLSISMDLRHRVSDGAHNRLVKCVKSP